MNQKTLLLIFGGNFYLFLQSLEGFLRAGAAVFAFCAAGLSVVVMAYKERHTIKQILGKGDGEKEQ